MKPRPFFGLLIALLSFGSCGIDNLENPSDLTLDQVVVLEMPESLKANGFDRSEITAHMRGDTPDTSTVTFRTDKGRFIGIPGTAGSSAKNDQEVKVKAAAGIAKALLISSTDVAVATVSASVGGFAVSRSLPFIPVDVNDVVTIEPIARPVLATGFDEVTIVATLHDTSFEDQVVTFEVDNGSLLSVVGTQVKEAKGKKIVVRASGTTARVILRSASEPVTATISVTVGGFTNTLRIAFEAPKKL